MKKYLIAMILGGILGYLHSSVVGSSLGALGMTLLLLMWVIFTPRKRTLPAPLTSYRDWNHNGYAGD